MDDGPRGDTDLAASRPSKSRNLPCFLSELNRIARMGEGLKEKPPPPPLWVQSILTPVMIEKLLHYPGPENRK